MNAPRPGWPYAMMLALRCFSKNIGREAFDAMSIEDQVALARDAGMEPADLIAALRWIDDYQLKRGEPLAMVQSVMRICKDFP